MDTAGVQLFARAIVVAMVRKGLSAESSKA